MTIRYLGCCGFWGVRGWLADGRTQGSDAWLLRREQPLLLGQGSRLSGWCMTLKTRGPFCAAGFGRAPAALSHSIAGWSLMIASRGRYPVGRRRIAGAQGRHYSAVPSITERLNHPQPRRKSCIGAKFLGFFKMVTVSEVTAKDSTFHFLRERLISPLLKTSEGMTSAPATPETYDYRGL